MERFRNAIALCALSVFTFIIYSNVLGGPFIFDDGMYIIENPQIREISQLWPPSPRFLTYLSFAFNFSVGGLDTFGYHLFNILLHVANSALVFAIVLLLFRADALEGPVARAYAFPMAIVASFLFAAHPLQTQAVSYVTQRFASLAAFFYLLSLAAYLKWRTSSCAGRAIFYAVALAAALCAQLTKEIGFTLPAVIVLVEFVFFRAPVPSGRIARLVPFVLVMAVVPVLMFAPGIFGMDASGLSEHTRAQQLKDIGAVSRHEYLATEFRVMVTYFRLIVLPVGQNLDYDYPRYASFLAPQVLLSALLVVPVFAAGVWLLARGMRGRGPLGMLAGFGIVFFFVAISIESSVIPINDVIYEHRTYLPNAGAALFFSALVMGLFALLEKRSGLKTSPLAWAVVATVLLAGPLAAATFSRNGLWADDLAFWQDTVAKSPGKGRVHNNYGRVLYKRGMTAEGMAEFKRAVELDPALPSGYYNLGNAYKDLGLMNEAIQAFEIAVTQEPSKTNARNNLGLAYLTVGRYSDAVREFEAVIALKPADFRAHNNLGLTYMEIGRLDIAEEEFRTALSIKPDFADALGNLRGVEMRRGME